MSRSELRDNLARLILGDELVHTSAEVAHKSGLTLDDSQRLWRALGFPDTGESVAYGDADVAAATIVAAAITHGVLDEETVFRMTRALGHTMSRLADWQVATLVEQVELDVEGGKSGNRLEAAVVLATAAGP
ncbi:MAG: adenylate cyclase regulatory domain-containing protein, partial [Ilumatobacteraceae bacterium]